MTKDRRDGDLDRTNVCAGAAKGGCVRELTRRLRAQHLGREDRADRTRDKPAIGKTTYILIHRTDIGTGTAADALEHLTPDGIFQDMRATIVEEDKMEFLWTELTLLPARTCDELCIGGKFLSGGRTSEQLQEDGEGFPVGNDR